MKTQKKIRLNYDAKHDMFTIEMWDNERKEWQLSSGHMCVARDGDNEPNFISYHILKTINHWLDMGYTLVCNYEF